jgi:peroxiredoxin
LGRAYADLQALGAEVIVIGSGQVRQARDYQHRLDLPFPVLADQDGRIPDRFQVGRWALGLVRHSAVFVIDPQGCVAYAHVVKNPQAALRLDAVRAALHPGATSGSADGRPE